jgi:hypothetical protein
MHGLFMNSVFSYSTSYSFRYLRNRLGGTRTIIEKTRLKITNYPTAIDKEAQPVIIMQYDSLNQAALHYTHTIRCSQLPT